MPCIVSFILFLLSSADTIPPGEVQLKKIDQNYRLQSDIKASVCITQQKSGYGTKTIQSVFYRRDNDNTFLIVITAPEGDKGNGYLRSDNNFWVYRHNTRTFQHISRNESIAGTDARGDDFEYRKFSEHYKVVTDASGMEKVLHDTLGKIPAYCLELIAIEKDVDYPRKKIWVSTDNYLLLKDQSYSGSGILLQTAFYLKYTSIDGSPVPVKQLYIDEFEKGNKSIVEITDIRTDKLNNDIFTKAYLENLSR